MLRLLGILAIGNLLLGGRHHRCSLHRGLLFGALLGYLANRDFDMDRARRDAGKAARKAKKAAHDAARAVREEIRNARKAEMERRVAGHAEEIRAEREARKAERERMRAEIREVREARGVQADRGNREVREERLVRGLPEFAINEARKIRELEEEMERNSRTAAMAADVPMIQFPEEDEKYHASRKYGYV